MVRLLLVLAPAISILSGIGVSNMVRFFAKSVYDRDEKEKDVR